MSVIDNWQQWKDFLGDRLDQGQQQGMNKETVNQLAYQIGDYLARQVDPKNEQQRVLSDMWSVADKDEQMAIAHVMVKLVENNSTQQ
ncbi:DUF3243 domain-containing protein [Cytobacillus dafuensis]|uniref:DUF3243 domain-containing protein n=1 Tax=Cytobacillus dafuensis TaxID=1742359 RepID=A0A5B8Z3D3_CYTDA|nr:DUF3243 domain-containing protein [Cytobacillus dafuensis]QED47610.1 DUF3243 domain-containing protein [Cytobacillus dafuensis]